MSWLNPGAAVFLALIPAVILLYFLRLRRHDVVVSSTLLWSRALEDRRVNAPFQRLRKSLLLLLQILCILILVGALARPEQQVDELEGLTHIVLVDVSASMGTVEDTGQTRLEMAREQVGDYLGGIGKREKGVVIRFARGARAITPVTNEIDVLQGSLGELRVHPSTTSIDAAIELALSIARNQVDAKAVVFSDGGFPAWEGGEIPLPIEYFPVGTDVPSSGIVALSSRLNLSVSPRPQLFVEVRNFDEVPVTGTVEIYQDGELIRADEPEIAANSKWSGSFEALAEGLINVRWDSSDEDQLELDNQAWVDIAPRRDLLIWRVGESNYFLSQALEALPNIDVEEHAAADVTRLLGTDTEPPDVVLWDRVAPERLPPVAGHLFLGAVPPGIWSDVPVEGAPEIIARDPAHAVNRFISYRKIEVIKESYVFPAAPGTSILVDTRGGGLISSFAVPGTRGIVVGFDILDSDWPLRPSFPLFLYNAFSYLAASDAGAQAGVRGEELMRFKAPPGVLEVDVHRPDGEVAKVRADADGWVRYSATDVLGPYRLAWSDPDPASDREFEQVLPVNLLSAAESDVKPRETLEVAGRKVEASRGEVFKTRREYWPWILAFALAFLVGEWYCYHRR